jgi:hypothetical protein
MRKQRLHFITNLALIFSIITIGGMATVNFGFRISDFGLDQKASVEAAQNQDPQSNSAHVADRNPQSSAPWINLKDGQDVPTVYAGAAGLEAAMKQGSTLPTALASDDFDEDGVADLISGYVGPGGGVLTLHRGNVEALWPRRQGSGTRDQGSATTDNGQRTTDATPFLPEARVFALPAAPDFLGAGDFDNDGHRDVVAAARGGQAVWLLPGDGRGGLNQVKQIPLAGQVTAMTVGEIHRADGLADVIVGIMGADGPQVLVFESPDGAFGNDERGMMNDELKTPSSSVHHSSFIIHRSPDVFSLPAPATALALGQLDEGYEIDLAIAAGSGLVIVYGRDRKLPLDEIRQADVPSARLHQHSLDFTPAALALGDFIWEPERRTEMALLADDGTIHMLKASAVSRQPSAGKADRWQIEPLTTDPGPRATGLVRAKVSSLPTDDLLVLDQGHHQVHILMQAAATQPSSTLDPQFSILDLQSAPVAVLPMRLNMDALSDLVILREGSTTPTVVLSAPLATFEVNSTGDGGDSNTADGVCNDGTGNCTLRAAIEQANASSGLDTINFEFGGTASTITPGSALPTITESVVIDGYSESGSSPNTNPITMGINATLTVELNGNSAGSSATGLRISAGSSTVRGLVINRFGNVGIRLQDSGSNLIEGNFIGTDVTGATDLGNSSDGVNINNAPGNIIGGTTTSAGNLISGNNGDGLEISNSTATGNQVQGNFIGTDVTGRLDLGNSSHGVSILRARGNTIGGTSAGARNLISGNNNNGVRLQTSSATGNQVQGNYIGTDVTGTKNLGNSLNGVFINLAPSNTIGGTAAGARNLISGNNNDGVRIEFSDSTGNQVQGNFIGTDVTGMLDLGNSGRGVFIDNTPGNTIGGTSAGARNLISGNDTGGVGIFNSAATENQVQGNFIGTDVTGTLDLGNSGDGVFILDAPGNTIGGTSAGAGNLISGNEGDGVRIQRSSAAGNQVQGNYIGCDVTGTLDLGNSGDGVFIINAPGNTIGGTATGAGNLISGNNSEGVEIIVDGATGNQVQGNLIGTQVDGLSALGNSSHGVLIAAGARNNTIGGTAMGSGNTIAFNAGDGVAVVDSTSTGNALHRNAIFSNRGLGIDLGNNGVTANDAGDTDTGANDLQDFPVLTMGVSSGSMIHIEGTIGSTFANSAYPITIEFFDNPACDGSGHGEGQTFLGSILVDAPGAFMTNIAGLATVVTATATNANGHTSEFSLCKMLDAPPTANAGPDQAVDEGSQVMLSGSGSDPDVGQTLSFMWTQTGGPAVTLMGANTATPTFAVVPAGSGDLHDADVLVESDRPLRRDGRRHRDG